MKVFDTTAVIAFLKDMDFQDGFESLSKKYKLYIPAGVAAEVTKQPTKEKLSLLIEKNLVKIVEVDQAAIKWMMGMHPQLGRGECEAIIYAEAQGNTGKICIVSDDKKARSKFGKLNFKWTERLIQLMKEDGMIDEQTHAKLMEKLGQSAFYYKGRKN